MVRLVLIVQAMGGSIGISPTTDSASTETLFSKHQGMKSADLLMRTKKEPNKFEVLPLA